MVSSTGVRRNDQSSGTGRVADRTVAVGRPVRRVRSASRSVTSPRVADMRISCVWGRVSSGTCQAQPRSGSA